MTRGEDTFASKPINEDLLSKVIEIKVAAAKLWELIDNIPVAPENRIAGRHVSIAKTELESSVMWAVKAYSRQ